MPQRGSLGQLNLISVMDSDRNANYSGGTWVISTHSAVPFTIIASHDSTSNVLEFRRQLNLFYRIPAPGELRYKLTLSGTNSLWTPMPCPRRVNERRDKEFFFAAIFGYTDFSFSLFLYLYSSSLYTLLPVIWCGAAQRDGSFSPLINAVDSVIY